mgnify:CR=1 FL=1
MCEFGDGFLLFAVVFLGLNFVLSLCCLWAVNFLLKRVTILTKHIDSLKESKEG